MYGVAQDLNRLLHSMDPPPCAALIPLKLNNGISSDIAFDAC